MFKTKVKPTTSNTSNQVKEADFSANLENDLNYDKDISLHLVKREEISTKCDEECWKPSKMHQVLWESIPSEGKTS